MGKQNYRVKPHEKSSEKKRCGGAELGICRMEMGLKPGFLSLEELIMLSQGNWPRC